MENTIWGESKIVWTLEVLKVVEKAGTENPEYSFSLRFENLEYRINMCKNMKWEFGNIGLISIKKTWNGYVVICDQYLSKHMKWNLAISVKRT